MHRLKAVESITCNRLRQRLGVADLFVAFRVRVVVRIAIVNAIDLCCLQNHVRADLARAQRGGGISGKIGIAGAGDENDDPSQFEVTNGAAENERLGHIFHFDRGLDACLDADLVAARFAGPGR